MLHPQFEFSCKVSETGYQFRRFADLTLIRLHFQTSEGIQAREIQKWRWNSNLGEESSLVPVFFSPLCTVFILTSHFIPSLEETVANIVNFSNNHVSIKNSILVGWSKEKTGYNMWPMTAWGQEMWLSKHNKSISINNEVAIISSKKITWVPTAQSWHDLLEIFPKGILTLLCISPSIYKKMTWYVSRSEWKINCVSGQMCEWCDTLPM